jgi:S-adenosylmethionine:tRNA ribosyltransferase-isomerase
MSDFLYELPPERIASHPLEQRDASRLLVYDRSSDAIGHHHFRDLPTLLPSHSLLIVNQSRVVAARLFMNKPTGGQVEVLLTEPVLPSSDPQVALSMMGGESVETCVWNCLIGGRRITVGMVLTVSTSTLHLTAEVVERNGSEGRVALRWSGARTLSSVLQEIGHVPLPPYIKRDDNDDDKHRYQTVFARDEGSVAAPTAGLHFTDSVLAGLRDRNVGLVQVTLHVGLGTFQPVEVESIADHRMHTERIEVDRHEVQTMIDHVRSDRPLITAVGTTSLRTIESLHWFGTRLLRGEEHDHILCEQWDAFQETGDRSMTLEAVAAWMDGRGLERAWGTSSLLLAPGCSIAVADALITNFHQPGNTLLLLVAAFAGEDRWRRIYDEALRAEYRMLSYGDSSLIVRGF